jgi:hypothetical protein
MYVCRRVFFGKRIHNGHEKTFLSLTTQANLLTRVMRLGGATRFRTAKLSPTPAVHTHGKGTYSASYRCSDLITIVPCPHHLPF